MSRVQWEVKSPDGVKSGKRSRSSMINSARSNKGDNDEVPTHYFESDYKFDRNHLKQLDPQAIVEDIN